MSCVGAAHRNGAKEVHEKRISKTSSGISKRISVTGENVKGNQTNKSNGGAQL